GRKQAVRRRLAQLAEQSRRAPVWRRLLTGGLIAALGLAGLTDAAVPTTPARLPTPDTSPIETRWKVDLPAGTSWKVVTPNQPSAEEVRRVVVYDLTATIARIRQDVPQLAETAVAAEIRQFLRPLLGLPFTESESQSDETRQERSHLELDGVRLIVSATAAQHVEVEQLIRRWAEHGQRQICHEVRFLVASDSLKDLIVGDGGQVLNFGASAENPLDRTPLERLASPLPQSLHRVPVFTRILAPHEAWAFEAGVARVSPTGPGTVTYGPKITAFEGTKSFMSDAVERSYVTGHRTRSDGSLEPQISKVMDGLSLQMKSLIAADGRSTQLRFQWQHSEVTDVEVLEMHGSGQETTIQIPHVSQTADSVAATIPDGHSLLIAPLRRNKQGQLMMFLVRPRVLTAEELK
ncbi:MAG TPA: hypothetical protein VL132_17750, partial [Planctomycetaceae bacterium]|nr:hypothetical protein [Planctomycetaceae bacterium]